MRPPNTKCPSWFVTLLLFLLPSPSFGNFYCKPLFHNLSGDHQVRERAIAQALKNVPERELRHLCGFTGCEPAAAGIAEILRRAGFPAQAVQTWHGLPFQASGGPKRGGVVYHHYVVVPGKTVDKDIIIDGTYLQFLTEIKTRNQIKEPLVLIGTRDELIEVFKRNQDRIRPQMLPEGAGYDPTSVVDNIYGFGEAAKFRIPASTYVPLYENPPGSDR